MNKSRIVSAIDLGSSKCVTLIAQVATDPNTLKNTVNIVGVSSIESKGVKKGQIINIDETVDAAIASIEAAERMAGYNLDSAYIALGGASVLSQNSQGVVAISDSNGEITDSDVDRVIEAASAISLPASREMIHIIPREFSVDSEGGVKDPVGMSGVRLEVETHLITASTSSVKNLNKAVNEMGVKIDSLVYSGLAASYSSTTETERELGCVLIEIGGGTTSVIAYCDGSISYSGVIPIGARNITNDLAIGLRISLDSAEKLKLLLTEDEKKKKGDDSQGDTLDLAKHGLTEIKKISKKTLCDGIIKPRLNEIFTIVRIELEKAGISGKVPSGAIITGGGANSIGIIDAAKRSLALPVRIGKPSGVEGLVDDILEPAYAVPLGLILYAASQTPRESLGSFTSKFKLPGKGVFGKLIETVKDLLP